MSTALSDAYCRLEDWIDGVEIARGDVARARRVLLDLRGKLDAPQLADVMHLIVQLGLAQDLLRQTRQDRPRLPHRPPASLGFQEANSPPQRHKREAPGVLAEAAARRERHAL